MSDHEKALARAGARALRSKFLADSINEIAEKYGGHTNGCSCLECQFVAYDREVKQAAQG